MNNVSLAEVRVVSIFGIISLACELSSSTVAVAQYISDNTTSEGTGTNVTEIELEIYNVYTQMRNGMNKQYADYTKLVLNEYLKLTGQEY